LGQRARDLAFELARPRAQRLEPRARLIRAQLTDLDLAVAPVQGLAELMQPADRAARAGGARRHRLCAERDQIGEAARLRLFDERERAGATHSRTAGQRERDQALVDDE